MKHWLLALAVFAASLVASAVIGFFAAIMLAGPHSGLLPEAMQQPVLLLLWICVIGVPLWFAYRTFRAVKRRSAR